MMITFASRIDMVGYKGCAERCNWSSAMDAWLGLEYVSGAQSLTVPLATISLNTLDPN